MHLKQVLARPGANLGTLHDPYFSNLWPGRGRGLGLQTYSNINASATFLGKNCLLLLSTEIRDRLRYTKVADTITNYSLAESR